MSTATKPTTLERGRKLARRYERANARRIAYEARLSHLAAVVSLTTRHDAKTSVNELEHVGEERISALMDIEDAARLPFVRFIIRQSGVKFPPLGNPVCAEDQPPVSIRIDNAVWTVLHGDDFRSTELRLLRIDLDEIPAMGDCPQPGERWLSMPSEGDE